MDDLRAYYEERLRQKKTLSVVPMNVSSNLDVGSTLGYIGDQSAYDEDWKILKAAYNGLSGTLRGLFGSMSAAVAQNVERHRQQDPNYVPYGGYAPAIAKGLENVARSSVLTPYNVKGDNAFTQAFLDLTQGAGQLVGQVGVTALTGGLGGAAVMGASIAGNQYLDLRDKGVSVDRAAQAGLENAIFQAPLEQLGVGKIMGKWGLNTAAKAKFREIAESAATEALTETLQQYPEAFTNIWAENEGKSADEVRDLFLSNLKDITIEGLYSGLIGGILGGAGSVGRLAFDRHYNRQINLKVQEAQLENMEERIDNIRKSGVNAKYAAVAINNNLQDDGIVRIDGETLYQVASEKGIEKTASALGIAQEEIVRAMEDGDTVEIRQGDFEAYCSTDQTFFQAVRDDISFNNEGYTINSLIAEAQMSKDVEISEEAQKEFDTAMADARKQMEVALIPKAQADAWEQMLISRANTYNPENPAQFFKNHPLEITRNGMANNNNKEVYYSKKHKKYVTVDIEAREKLRQVENAFASNIDRWKADSNSFNKKESGKLFKLMDMPLVMQLIGIPKMELQYYGSFFSHAIRKEHPGMDVNVLKQLPKALADPIAIFKSEQKTDTYISMLEITDNNGATVVAVVEINKVDINKGIISVVNSAFGKTKQADEITPSYEWFQKQFENNNAVYINKKKSNRWLQSIRNESPVGLALFNNALTQNIYDETDFVKSKQQNKGYYQIAYHGTPYEFSEFDLGAIGTGEGNQVHGWGLYFAQDQNIARGYKEMLSEELPDATEVMIGDKSLQQIYEEILEDVDYGRGDIDVLSEKQAMLENYIAGRYEKDSALKPAMEMGYSQESIDWFNDLVKDLKFNKGSLFEADVPEDDVLLDEQKTFAEQPVKVRKAITKLVKNLTEEQMENFDNVYSLGKAKVAQKILKSFEDIDGGTIYGTIYDLIEDEGTGKNTSELLNKYGVKGITYDGGRDGRCFVVFDDKAISVIETYNQQAKGQIDFKEGKSIINLFEGADASTVIHETGHYFVEAMVQDIKAGRANQQMIDDWNTLLEYCEITQDEWDKGGEARRKAHERLAEGFETYIMEGKAPTNKLRKAFSRFSKWLKAVYKKIARNQNAVPLTDEVREVFDRMLASEELIKEQARADGIFAILPKVITDNLSDKSIDVLADFVEKAREKAEVILVRDALKDFAPERKKAIKAYREEWLPRVREAVLNEPLYAASEDIPSYIGSKQTIKTIARKYKNADGMIYTDWREELNAVEVAIEELLAPTIKELRQGYGKGVSIIPYDEDGRGFLASNNALWYQEWFKEHKRKPNESELRELAYGAYTGKNDILGIWSSAGAGLTEAEYAEMEAEQARLTAEIDELIARRDELVEMKDAVKPFKHLGLTLEQRQKFDQVAEGYDFASGEELANKLLEAPTLQEAIDARLEELVKQKFPDVFQERSAAGKAAREALYNNGTAEVVGLELELINEALEKLVAKEKAEALKPLKVKTISEEDLQARERSKKEMAELAKARKMQADVAAEAEFKNMSIRKAVHTENWIAAERRCAEKAAEAAAKGDLNRAAGYKKQQLYNHACVRKSLEVRKRYQQSQKYVNKQFRAKRDTWYREEYFNQACAIFARMGLQRKDYDPRLNDKTLAQFISEMQELHDNIDIAPWIVQGSVDISKPVNLTLSQYEDVINCLRNIKAMARSAKCDNAFNSQQTFDENKAEMLSTLLELDDKWNPNSDNKTSFVDNYVAQNMTASTMFEMMDGNKLGYFSNVIYKQGNICENKRADMLIKFEDAIMAATKEWLPDRAARKQASAKVAYAELGGATLDKHELVNMLIYLTTESSSNKLCSMAEGSTYDLRFKGSQLFVEGDLNQTRQNLLNFLGKYLTAQDFKYAQAKSDACNMFWGELSDLEYRTKGFRPKKELAYPAIIEVPNGAPIKFTGGYMPLIRDRSSGSRPARQEVLQGTDGNANTSGANIMQLHTNTGSTKSRDASVYPLQLRGNYAFGAVRDTITDIAMREYLSHIRRFLDDKEISETLVRKIGEANRRVFVEHFYAMARPYGGGGYNNFADKVTGEWMGALRKITTHFAIMGKLSTALQNFGNIVLYGGSVEGFTHMDALSALGNYFKTMDNGDWGYKAMLNTALAESSYMRERMRIPDITMRDIDIDGDMNIVEEKAMKFGTQLLVHTDNITSLAVYMQARNKAIQEGKSVEDAVLFAEEVIKRTLGSNRRADVSSTFRAQNLKLFTIFTSFFNTQYNQWLREYRIDKQLFLEGKKSKAMANALTFVAAKYVMANALSLLLTGVMPWDDDDDDGYNNLTKSLVSYPFQLGGWQTQAGAVVVQELMGMDNYGYRMSPAESVFNTAISVGTKTYKLAVGKGEVEDLAEPLSNLFAMGFGVPQQAMIWIWNGYDLFANDMDFEARDVLRRRPVKDR